MQETQNTLKDYVKPEEFLARYPNLLDLGELRHIMNNRHYNGFGKAVKRLNYRKFLIHIPSALAWIEGLGD